MKLKLASPDGSPILGEVPSILTICIFDPFIFIFFWELPIFICGFIPFIFVFTLASYLGLTKLRPWLSFVFGPLKFLFLFLVPSIVPFKQTSFVISILDKTKLFSFISDKLNSGPFISIFPEETFLDLVPLITPLKKISFLFWLFILKEGLIFISELILLSNLGLFIFV